VKKISLVLSALALPLLLTGCAKPAQDPGTDNPDHVNFYAEDARADFSKTDPLRDQLGRLFLVEQPTITVNPTLVKAIQSHTPGGILLWNENKVGAVETREVVRAYSQAAKNANKKPILFSIDYEGGALELSPSGHMIAGVQRIRQGLTALAHPVWLGRTMPAFGDEACSLHGDIIAKELLSIGINYPLATASDLAERFMLIRGTSTNPELAARCMEAVMKSVAAGQNMVFVTKHFPGLGQVAGDTHEGTATSVATDWATMEVHLKPFRELLAALKAGNEESKLSIMSTHALFPLLDKEHLTTESPATLTTLLRDQMQFQGIRLSDAMWMGDYGKMGNDQLMAVYISAILAGEDMLMIPGTKFATAMQYVWNLYDGALSATQQQALEQRLGAPLEDIRNRFKARLQEVYARPDFSVGTIHHSVDIMSASGQLPTDLTATERARYYEILKRTDPRWASILGN
jgi:beta-N-acetylhexosaminidase